MYKVADIPNGYISYYTIGSGNPLVLLPGFSCTFMHWNKDFLDAISQKYTVYCINYRGVGYSKANDNNIDIELFAEDIAQFIDIIDLKNCSVLGYSMGGYVAQELALNYPEKIKELYLVSSKTGGIKVIQPSAEILAKLEPREMSLNERIQERLDLNFPIAFHAQMRPIQLSYIEQYALPECALDLTMLQKQREAIRTWNNTFSYTKYSIYSSINIPTAIFCGLQDVLIPYQNSLILCELIPHSRLTIFSDGGHGILGQFGHEIGKIIIK